MKKLTDVRNFTLFNPKIYGYLYNINDWMTQWLNDRIIIYRLNLIFHSFIQTFTHSKLENDGIEKTKTSCKTNTKNVLFS